MDLIWEVIRFAREIGSLICFQWEKATFKIGEHYFPVCSGCFGIYLGSLIALTILPFLTKFSKKLYSIKYGLPTLLPFLTYWIILRIELITGNFIVPGIKEVYCFTGMLVGTTISNAAYRLGLETEYQREILKIGRKFWILTLMVIVGSLATFFLRPFDVSILFSASLLFITGFFGLIFFISMWIVASIIAYLKKSDIGQKKALVSILTLLTIFGCFQLFQILIFSSNIELIILGMISGISSLGLFSFSLKNFTSEELGLTRRKWKKQVFYGLLIGMGLYSLFGIYRFLTFNEVIFLKFTFDYINIPAVFVIVLAEEFFFRGYAIGLLNRYFNKSISCIVPSILFTIYHKSLIFKALTEINFYVYESLILVFAGGLLLSYLFIKNRSLVMPITVHLFWDVMLSSKISLNILQYLSLWLKG